jgi:hypothetical protein
VLVEVAARPVAGLFGSAPGQGITPGGSGAAEGPALGALPRGVGPGVDGPVETGLDVGGPPDGSAVNPHPTTIGSRPARSIAAARARATRRFAFTAAL